MRKTFGLALGSGGARGLVHIGVLKCLDEAGLKPDYFAGSSIGSCVAAMYAAGQSAEEITEQVLDKKWKAMGVLFDPTILSGGLVKGERFEKLMRAWVGVDGFEDLKIPLTCVATDLISGDQVEMDKGDLYLALRASMAVPALFSPIEFGDALLVDGGVCNPVPDDVVRKMGADVVISVNLDHRRDGEDKKGQYKWMTNVNLRSLNILRHYLAEYSMRDSDIILNPEIDDPGIIGFQSFIKREKAEGLIDLGYQLMKDHLEELEELLASS